MTAVAVQQRSHPRQQYSPRQPQLSTTKGPLNPQARNQSYISSGPGPAVYDDHGSTSSSNGATSTMSARTPASNDSSKLAVANGGPIQHRDATPLLPIANGSSNGAPSRDTKQPDHDRPTSAPGGKVGNTDILNLRDSTNEDSDREPARRRPKLPILLRSKSDFGPRGDDSDSQRQDNDSKDWGARHGFEDHYASEEYVSQLANVSCSLSI